MNQYDDLESVPANPARTGSVAGANKPLGKLAQSARKKEISGTRRIMFVIGVLNLIVGGILFAASESLVDAQIEAVKRQQPGVQFDPGAREEAISETKVGAGIVIALAVVYFVLGFIVNKAPVPITIAGLSIYLGSIAIGALIEPASLLQGGIVGIAIRIAIILALVRAVRAAFAYQREVNLERAARKPGSMGGEFA